MFFLPTYCRG